MRPTRLVTWCVVGTVALLVAPRGDAKSFRGTKRFPGPHARDFALESPLPTPVARPPTRDPARHTATGSTIVSLGNEVLFVEADEGELVRQREDGTVSGRLPLGRGLAQLVVEADGAHAWVADRGADRVLRVDLTQGGITQERALATAAEPWGLARVGSHLLVSCGADRRLQSFDLESGALRSEVALDAEPRGITVAPDGRSAWTVSPVAGALTRVDLDPATGRLGRVEAVPLPVPATHLGPRHLFGSLGFDPAGAPARHARGGFAVLAVGDAVVAPYAVATPVGSPGNLEDTGLYGGGGTSEPPIEHRLAWFGDHDDALPGAAKTSVHQPRALAWDREKDVLYVAGYGDDRVLAVAAASTQAPRFAWTHGLGTCGPAGLAVAADGRVWVHCELGRNVAVLERRDASVAQVKLAAVTPGRTSALVRRGADVFRRSGDVRISKNGALACASCHPEGGADGLSWRISGTTLQTPVLAGRLVGTHPFKWDGGDRTLDQSLAHTTRRLGGRGLATADREALAAFLTSLEPPRRPTPPDRGAVERGREIFARADVGCDECHSGPTLSDGSKHRFGRRSAAIDTPSLIGLAASAPYFHDGSARTLRAVVAGTGSVHGMGETSHLADHEIDDLVAFLRTL
jgi:sugar lactone lactonase YvrE